MLIRSKSRNPIASETGDRSVSPFKFSRCSLSSLGIARKEGKAVTFLRSCRNKYLRLSRSDIPEISVRPRIIHSSKYLKSGRSGNLSSFVPPRRSARPRSFLKGSSKERLGKEIDLRLKNSMFTKGMMASKSFLWPSKPKSLTSLNRARAANDRLFLVAPRPRNSRLSGKNSSPSQLFEVS